MSEIMNPSLPPAATPAKHGYYSDRLSGDMLVAYEKALGIQGLDDEIALLRALISVVMVNAIGDLKLLFHAFNCAERLSKTNRKVFRRQGMDLEEIRDRFAQAYAGCTIPADLFAKRPL